MSVDPATLKAYRQCRKAGCRASTALESVKDFQKERPFEFQENRFTGLPYAKWEQDVFRLELKVVIDENPDTSYLGEFTPIRCDRCVPNPNAKGDRNRCEWIKLAVTEEEHYRELLKEKYGKLEARRLAQQYVQRDVERLAAWGEGDEPYYGVIVKAFKKGVELGEASVWGVDSADESYLYELAEDLASESLDQAKATLEDLCCNTSEEEKRERIEKLARHFTVKFGGKCRAGFDDEKHKYYVKGDNLPPAPEMASTYPNGWTLIDYFTASEVDQLE